MGDNPFDRVMVDVYGERLTGRPVEFEMDGEGNVVRALTYETTCPSCGGMVTFDAGITVGLEVVPVTCAACGPDASVSASGTVVQNVGQKIIDPEEEGAAEQDVFVDPVAEGSFYASEMHLGHAPYTDGFEAYEGTVSMDTVALPRVLDGMPEPPSGLSDVEDIVASWDLGCWR